LYHQERASQNETDGLAMDINNDVVIIITAYKPSSEKWESNGKTRRMP
jgi:hypothetical protein